ncbi:MAG: molybdate ABC transporter permease subunit [Candidatus Methanoperedenaceae archaeon]|nr:molybdate ABC transporter permease subunit [Candidatus Methanoperedenaceae archaeon]
MDLCEYMDYSPLYLSMWVSVIATVIIAASGTFAAYLLARKRFFGRNALDAFTTLPMILPPTVTGYYLIILLGRNGIIGKHIYDLTGLSIMFTWQAAVIAATVVAMPIMIKSAKAAIESVDREFEKAAFTLGKSEIETFFLVTLPLAKKGLMAGLILSFARALGEFGATIMLAGNIPGKTSTMPLAIYSAVQTGEDTLATTLVIILTIISIAVIYITTRISESGRYNA